MRKCHLLLLRVVMSQALDSSAIWCASPIASSVQAARIFEDSKDFVDSPLLVSPEECWARWKALPTPPTPEALRAFVAATFGPPGKDLEPWAPPDHDPEPALLARLPAGAVREWARSLNDLWVVLGRKLGNATAAHPERSTLLPARHGFVVPGGRFREAYYWDTYWIVLGLLSVGMRQTAASAASNLLDAARAYGFVPNGLRAYYLNRSQPPLLTQTIAALVDAIHRDEEAPAAAAEEEAALLEDALPVLDAEYAWWMRRGDNGSAVELAAAAGRPAGTLNRYVVLSSAPRPESWREDTATAAAVAPGEREALFGELAAGAETGWDYSTRWLRPDPAAAAPAEATAAASPAPSALSRIRTSSILPVELNSILYRNERTLAALHSRLAQLRDRPASTAASSTASAAAAAAAAAAYADAAAARLAAMDGWLWNATTGRWHDFEWREGVQLAQESAASYVPLWAGAHSAAQAAAASAALGQSELLQLGGVATTLAASGQQWDWPNAWPPLQQMLVEGLDRCGAPGAAELGEELARRWLHSNLLGWSRDRVMHEKYDATRPGERGGGGEYTPQVGFGWTNGAALWMLQRYADSAAVRELGSSRLGESRLASSRVA